MQPAGTCITRMPISYHVDTVEMMLQPLSDATVAPLVRTDMRHDATYRLSDMLTACMCSSC